VTITPRTQFGSKRTPAIAQRNNRTAVEQVIDKIVTNAESGAGGNGLPSFSKCTTSITPAPHRRAPQVY
jgi:hypothetical protein